MPPRKKPVTEKGYFPRLNLRTGAIEHRIRIAWYGKMTWFGPYPTKTAALHEIQRRRVQLREVRQSPGQTKPTLETVEALIAAYLRDLKGQVGEYRAQIRYGAFWSARFKGRPVLSLEPAEVWKARGELKRRPGKRGVGCLADSTADHYCKFLRAMMHRTVRPKAWVLEFWSEVTIKKAIPVRPRAVYTEAQEAKLYTKLRDCDILFCRLLYLLGIRGGQMVINRWEWLSWGGKVLQLPAFKKHPAREIPLEAEALEILRYWWKRQGKPTRGWVFPDPTDSPSHLNYHNWYTRHFRPALIRAGLDNLGLDAHALRHTWATRLGGTTPSRVLQMLGGWGSLSQVEIYTKPAAGPMRDAMREASTYGTKTAKKLLRRILEKPANPQ